MTVPSMNSELCGAIIAENSQTHDYSGEPEFSPLPRRERRNFKPAPEKFSGRKPKCVKRQPSHHH